jgi:uncharacterized protein (TIGR03000 family)
MKTMVVFCSKYRFVALTAIAFGLTALSSSSAEAGGSWGSSRGGFASSGGSWGSSGGSFGSSGGSFGSSGGSSGIVVVRRTPVRNLLARVREHHVQRWSASSGGSSGGSQGVWLVGHSLGSSGSWSGSTGSFGSSGGSSGGYSRYGSSVAAPTMGYATHEYPMQIINGVPTEAPISDGGSINSMLEGGLSSPVPESNNFQLNPVPQADSVPRLETPGPDLGTDGTSLQAPVSDTAVLNLKLPENTKVFINNKLTKTSGSLRSYVSRNLKVDRDYKYQIKAVLVRDGKELVRTKLVKMRPGINKTVDFNFDEPVMTTLALEVPADAKVKICGKEMSTTGPVRSYTTRLLKDGEVWNDYKVTVEYQRDGKPHVEERTIDLLAGDLHRMSIGVDSKIKDQIASK